MDIKIIFYIKIWKRRRVAIFKIRRIFIQRIRYLYIKNSISRHKKLFLKKNIYYDDKKSDIKKFAIPK